MTLLISHLLTLTSTTYQTALFNMLSKLPIEKFIVNSPIEKIKTLNTQNKLLASNIQRQKMGYQAKVRKAKERIKALNRQNKLLASNIERQKIGYQAKVRKAKERIKALNRQNKLLASNIERQKIGYQAKVHKAKLLTNKVVKRTVRNVATNASSVALESVPFIGMSTILMVTAMDIKDGCDTIKDTNQLLLLLEDNAHTVDENTLCSLALPSLNELPIPTLKEVVDSYHQYLNHQRN